MPQIGKKSALRKIKKNILTAGPEALGCLVGSPHLNSRSCASGGFFSGDEIEKSGVGETLFLLVDLFFAGFPCFPRDYTYMFTYFYIYICSQLLKLLFKSNNVAANMCVYIYICVECAVSASNGELRARNTTQGAPKNDTLL